MYQIYDIEKIKLISAVAVHPLVVSEPARIYVWVVLSDLYLNTQNHTREFLYDFYNILMQNTQFGEDVIEDAISFFVDADILVYTDDLADKRSYFVVDVDKAKEFYNKRDMGAPVKPKRGGIEFEVWWSAYGKKVGSTTSLKIKWNKLAVKTQHLIMAHTAEYVKSTPNKVYRKNPQTYLNQQAWLDEIIASESKPVEYTPVAVITIPTTDVPDEVKQRYERLRSSAHG